MNRHHFLKTILSLFGALALTACASREVTVREPVNMPIHTEADSLTNTVVYDHVGMSAPEGWHFRRKKKDDPKEVLFWISDGGSNSTHGVVRMNKLDFEPDMSIAGPRYAELAMPTFVERESRETVLGGYPAQIVSGKHEEKSIARISALVSTRTTNLVEITFASSSNQFLANPQVAYSILGSYKLTSSSLSVRYLRGAFSFRCQDGQWTWMDDLDGPFLSRGFGVIGPVENAAVVIQVAQTSATQFRDILNMKLYKDPEYEAEVHLAGMTFPARGIAYQNENKGVTDTRFLFKHEGKDYLLGVVWITDNHELVDIKTLPDHPMVRAALDNNFFYNN